MRPANRRPRYVLAAVLLAGATGLSSAALAAPSTPQSTPSTDGARTAPEARGFYDARQPSGSTERAAQARAQARASARPATRSLERSLGDGSLLDIDAVTGTPRLVGMLDGYLTDPSSASPRSIAMGYLRDNLAGFGLETSDLSTLHFRDDYVDIAGTHHLSWSQTFPGLGTVFGYGLQASVTKTGQLLTIGGSPVPGRLLTSPKTGQLSASDAIRAARKDAGDSSLAPASEDRASRVLFVTRTGAYSAWETITMSSTTPSVTVRDAASGRLLYRRPLGQSERSPEAAKPKHHKPASKGVAFQYFPKATHGGRYVTVNYTKHGWLPAGATKLKGNNSHAYSDLNDNGRPSRSEEVRPRKGSSWNYKLQPFHLGWMSFCDNPYPCSWNPRKPYSWQTNRAQNTAQVFFFVNNFHDHLLKAPIGFTEDAGNFEARNTTGKGQGHDAVSTQTMDGANTSKGLPDGAHLDNANMDTPPDGIPPVMQMYLQHQPGTTYPDGDPFPANNTGDEGDTVYHEYTHGLSNRLVVDPNGYSSLGGVQAGAMGEAWSDWYAFDYLVKKGLQPDAAGTPDVRMGLYDGAGMDEVRYEAIDCPVGDSASENCTGGETAHTGGFTYADYGQVYTGPEVHADGEIWVQTLWDLRSELGSRTTESLVTRAMELAPYDPSYLDMRNAILMADTAVYGMAHHSEIWSVFAHRGMGYLAGSLGGEDAAPAASFDVPSASGDTGTITGTVTNKDTGEAVANVPVTLAFQGGDSVVNPTAITDADGHYAIGPVPVGEYGKLVVTGAGYDTTSTSVTVTDSGGTADLKVRRDWAAKSGGAEVTSSNGPNWDDYGCGPSNAIDGSQATGWSSTTGDDNGTPTNVMVPKFMVVKLPQGVDVTEIGVDPAATCGDGGSASLGQYKVELSANGSTWTQAAAGTFTLDDRGEINLLTPTGGTSGARYLRLTMQGNQTPDFATNCPLGNYSGCQYTDVSEVTVYGTPSA